MAENFQESLKIQTGDLVSQGVKDYYDVFVCVIADDDVFVLARPQIRKIPMEDGVEIVGYKRENCKVYDNNVETLNKYNFEVLV